MCGCIPRARSASDEAGLCGDKRRERGYVDQIPKTVKGRVGDILSSKDEMGTQDLICQHLDLTHLRDKNVEDLSGGELQRFACTVTCIQQANIYMFDEPSSYLDVKQRLMVANAIRSLIAPDRYIIVVDHDLGLLYSLSDYMCCLCGVSGAYGVVSTPFSVREEINIFLDGYIPTESPVPLVFKAAEEVNEEEVKRLRHYQYPEMKKTMDNFTLEVKAGEFTDSEIVVMLGENGTGKTTFIRMLAGSLKPDGGSHVPDLNISYKPQFISRPLKGTVRALLHDPIRDHPQFITDVMKPIKSIIDQENLSGGEMQRVALTLCLGKPADVSLIDEPSSHLDREQRLMVSRVIGRFILHAKEDSICGSLVVKDLADRGIVFEGVPSKQALANTPESLCTGMCHFLEGLGISFRRDPINSRLPINQPSSNTDREQKKTGTYFRPNE